MKKLIVLLFVCTSFISAQVDITGGMGINFLNSSSLTDYINYAFADPSDKVADFTTAVDFAGEVDYYITPKYQIGVEYSFMLYNFNTTSYKAGYYDFSYVSHRPTVLGYYVKSGKGYALKFGAGLGIRYIAAEEQLSNSPDKNEYSALGLGLLARFQGHTALGEKVFAYIGFDLNADFPGELSDDNDNKIINKSVDENVTLNSVSAGIKLGISYHF